jgi:transketolase
MATKSSQAEQVAHWEQVVTVEDHLQDAGFGSWMCEALAGVPQISSRIKVKALTPLICGMVGRQEVLNEFGGLTCS